MALNVNIIGKDSEGNLRALKVNSEGNLDFGQLETEIQVIKDNQGRLYGKYGEAWIPVKVDSEGRPIIASDVTVNAEGMVVDLGQIKQGPAGTEPWLVQQSGTIVLLNTITSTITAGSTVQVYSGNLEELAVKEINVQWYCLSNLDMRVGIKYYRYSDYSGAPYGTQIMEEVNNKYSSLGEWAGVLGPYFVVELQNRSDKDVTLSRAHVVGRLG